MPARTVSVVIPTIGRTSLRTAVESALQQAPPPLEIIVVLDADCEPDLPPSDTVRILRTSGGVGPSAAKHIGVESARGNIIALLDDDDVWHPNKLEVQLAAAPPGDEWVISSRFFVHIDGREPVLAPRAVIRRNEPIAPYLFEFRERQAFNMVQTSTLVFPRTLTQLVPMSVAAGSIHDDPKWLIEVRRAFPNLPIIQLTEPLVDVMWTAVSVSRAKEDRSKELIDWGKRELADESKRVRGDYMLTSPVGSALAVGSYRGVIRSIVAGVRYGRPGLLAWASAAKSMLRVGLGRIRTAISAVPR
jgi:glycosyltransferase involved in cell wall biosynthesis